MRSMQSIARHRGGGEEPPAEREQDGEPSACEHQAAPSARAGQPLGSRGAAEDFGRARPRHRAPPRGRLLRPKSSMQTNAEFVWDGTGLLMHWSVPAATAAAYLAACVAHNARHVHTALAAVQKQFRHS